MLPKVLTVKSWSVWFWFLKIYSVHLPFWSPIHLQLCLRLPLLSKHLLPISFFSCLFLDRFGYILFIDTRASELVREKKRILYTTSLLYLRRAMLLCTSTIVSLGTRCLHVFCAFVTAPPGCLPFVDRHVSIPTPHFQRYLDRLCGGRHVGYCSEPSNPEETSVWRQRTKSREARTGLRFTM